MMAAGPILSFLPWYVIGFVSLYSIIAWGLIFESRKKLSDGYIKTFSSKILVGVGLIYILTVWFLFINVRLVKDVQIQLLNYVILLIMVIFITWVAVSINKMGNQFGFKMVVGNIMKYIEKEKKKPEQPPKLESAPSNQSN
jgi:hypothetical protein